MDSTNVYCRFCAKQKPPSEIFGHTNDTETLENIKNMLTALEINFVDYSDKTLPKSVCRDCYGNLNGYQIFFNNIKESQVVLQGLFPYKCKPENIFEDYPQYSEIVEIKPEIDQANESNNNADTPCSEANNSITWSTYPYSCLHCKTPCNTIVDLREHCKAQHGICHGFQCADCEDVIHSFSGFTDHVREHRPELIDKCEYCDFIVSSENQYIIHINNHIFNYQCEACGEFFHDNTLLHIHTSTYNRPKPTEIPLKRRENKHITLQELTCDTCGKIYATPRSLQKHKKLHTTAKRDNKCDQRGETFFDRGILNADSINQKIDTHICEICKKTFSWKHSLKKHVLTHYGDKPFECLECSRQFRHKGHLKSHMIIHTDETPFSCQYCKKVFKFKSVMRTHEHQHTGARLFPCTFCNMEFANWSNCNKHMKRRHGRTLAKYVMTPQGKLPINPITGKPIIIKDLNIAKEWVEGVLKGSKSKKSESETNDVSTQNS